MKKLLPLIIALSLLIACDNEGYYGSLLNSAIVEFIQREYRGATIRSAEYDDDGYYEVEIKHDSYIKDVYFDKDDNWVYTTWDVKVSSLPSAVRGVISERYPGYRIDDVDFVEYVDKSYYKVELERGELEQAIYISKDGNLHR